MNAQLATDAIFRTTELSARSIIGASLTGSASDSGWYRLLPDGVTATRPADNQLMLANLRSDVDGIDLKGWIAIIANDGYRQERQIVESENGLITIKPGLRLQSRIADEELGADNIRYILTPRLLNSLNIAFDNASSGELEIGYSTSDLVPGIAGYSREIVSGETADPTIISIASIAPGNTIAIPVVIIDNLFYKFTSSSADNRFYWGEQHLVSGMSSGALSAAGGSVRVVDTVPATSAAQENTLYVRKSDDTEWYLGEQSFARVPASITDIDLVARSDWTWLNELTADPTNDAASAYYNTTNGVFRRKAAGPLSPSITTGAFTLFATGTYIGAFATDPALTLATEEFYYNTTDHRFRFHTPIDTEWFNETFLRAFDGVFIRDNQANTAAEVAAWLQINHVMGEDYAYYDEDDDVVYDVASFTRAALWIDTTIDAVVSDSAAIFLGADVNSIDAVIAHFVANGYNSLLRQFFYNATEIREVTAYTAEVPAYTVPEIRQTAGGGGSGLNQGQVDARVRAIALIDQEFTEVANQSQLNAVDITNVVPFVKVTAGFGTFTAGDRLVRDSVSGEWAVFIAASDFSTNGGDSDSGVRGFITVPPADVSDGGHEVSLSVPSVDAYSNGLRLGYYVEVVATLAGLSVEVNSLGERGVVRKDLSSFEAGDLEVGQFIVIQYDSVNVRFVSDFQPGGAAGGNSLQPSYFWVFQRATTRPTAQAGTYSSSGNSYTPAGDWQLEANTGNNPLWGMPVSISSGGNPSVGEIVRLTHNSLDQPNSFWIFREVAERPDTAPGAYSLSTGVYTPASGWSLRFPIQNRTHPVWGMVITISATGSIGTTGNPIQLTQLFRNVTIDTVNDQSELDAVDTRNRVAYARIATAFDTYQINDIWVYIDTDDEWQLLFRATGGGNSLQGTSFWIFREQANTEPTVESGTYVAATNVYTPPSGWQRLFPENPSQVVWGAIVQISATSESVDVNDTPVQLTQHNSLQPSTFWIFRIIDTRPTALASGSYDRATGEFTPTDGWTITFPTGSTTVWGRVVRISPNGNVGTSGSAVQFTNLLGAVTVTEVADQAALNAIDTAGQLAYAKVTALFDEWRVNDLLVYTGTWELLIRLGVGGNSLQPSYFWVFQDSSSAPTAEAGTYDSDTNIYTPAGDWSLEAHGTPANILWGMPVAIASDGTPTVGVVVQLTELNALQPSSFWIFRASSTDPGIASGSYSRSTGIFTPAQNWSLTFPSTSTIIWGRTVRITPSGGVNTLGNSIQLTHLFGRVRITETADQDELDAVGTVGEVAYAKVTAAFGSWQVNDILIYTDTWELLIRLGAGSNSLQPSYFWVFQDSSSAPTAEAGTYDSDTNTYTPAGDWSLEAHGTPAEILWGMPVAIASDGTPTVGVVVQLTELNALQPSSFWIFRASTTDPGIASGSYDRAMGIFTPSENWSLTFPSTSVPIWGRAVRITPSGDVNTLGNSIQLTHLFGRVRITEVADQDGLDAVGTVGEVAYAKVTAVFGSWQVNDILIYTDTWELLIRLETGSNSLQPSYFWIFQRSTSEPTATSGSYDTATNVYTPAGNWLFEAEAADPAVVTNPDILWGLPVSIAADGTPTVSEVVRLTHHDIVYSKSFWIFRASDTRPSSASGAYNRATGQYNSPSNWSLRFPSDTQNRTVPIWGQVVEIDNSGSPSVVGNPIQLTNLGRVTVTEADNQGELDAIATADRVTFARITTAFDTYQLSDIWTYIAEEDEWQLLFRPVVATVTKASVYNHTKEIIEAGGNTTVVDDDTAETVTIAADQYHLSVQRTYMGGTTPESADRITINVDSGDVYDLTIFTGTGAEALPPDFLNRLVEGVPIRVATMDNTTLWKGNLVEVHSIISSRVDLQVDFGDRVGTFTNADDVVVSFGYARADVRRFDYLTVFDNDVTTNTDEDSDEIDLRVSAIMAYTEGIRLGFYIQESNVVDNVRIRVNQLPYLQARKEDYTQFAADEFVGGRFVVIQYNPIQNDWISDIPPASGRPTRAEVYNHTKEIVEAGLNATVTDDDTARTVTVASDNPSNIIFLDTNKVTHTSTNTFLNLLPTIVPSAYYDGLSYKFTVKASNIGNDEGSLIIYVGDITTTLLSPYPVRYADGSAFARGEFPDGRTITITFDLANNEWRSNVTPALTSAELQDSTDTKQGTLSGEDLVAAIEALSLGEVEYTEVADAAGLAAVDTARVAFVKVTADFGIYVIDDFLIWNTVSSAWVVLFNVSSDFNGVSFTEVDNQNELDAIVTYRRVAFAKATTPFGTYEQDDYLLYVETSWELFFNITSIVTQAAVYPRVRAILQAGGNISLAPNDTTEQIEISADNPSRIVYLNASDVTITSGFYTLRPDPLPSAYTQGLAYKFRLTVGSTSSGTIQVRVGEAGEPGSLALRPLRHVDGSNVQPSDLRTGQILTITYDAVNSRWLGSTRPTISESQIESPTSDTPGMITGRRWKQAYDEHAAWAGGPPTWVYYGFSQTSRMLPVRRLVPQDGQSTIYTFDSTLHESGFGANTSDVSFLTTTEAADVDTRDNVLGPANNAVFEIVAGVWNIFFSMRINDPGSSFLVASLYRMQSGLDDFEIDYNFPFTSSNIRSVIQLNYKFLELSATTAFYFLVGAVKTAEDSESSGYMILEKLE